MPQPSIDEARLTVDERAVAAATGLSVSFLRKDRRTKRLVPFSRVGDRCLYFLPRVRDALLALEEGGAPVKARKNRKKAARA